MPIVLKRFSQDVDLENPSISSNYLVFFNGQNEFRIPVPAETIKELSSFIYQSMAEVEDSEKEEEEEEKSVPLDAQKEFDQLDEDEDFFEDEPSPEEDAEIYSAPPTAPKKTSIKTKSPMTEDEVPSL